MVILYLVFLLPLTLDAYHLAGYGKFCSDSSTRITNQATCKDAAAALSLHWGHGFMGTGDFPGCLHTKDPRNKVYFNHSPDPSTSPTSERKFANYAEICTGEGPEKDYDLVTTGGNNDATKWSSSEIIGYLGVCSTPNIPHLTHETVAGQSVWQEARDILMFCGGSNNFVGFGTNWGATDKCFTLKPGHAWIGNGANYMKTARAWFSMTMVDKGRVIAAGGHDGDGNVLKSVEKYDKYSGTWGWRIQTALTLPNPVYGHCAVHFKKIVNNKEESFLLLIGGSSSDGPDPILHASVCGLTACRSNTGKATLINLDTNNIHDVDPYPLPPLWAPACTKVGDDVFVSGGANPNVSPPETSGVYKYNINSEIWSSHNDNIIYPRWGHVMGKTAQGEMVVAGGYAGTHLKTYNNIEARYLDGTNWAVKQPGLKKGGQYMAMAQVPVNTFKCNLVQGECRLSLCSNLGDCDEACSGCESQGYYGVCESRIPPGK